MIHAAFGHDPTNQARSAETDRRAIEALGRALAGSARPLVVTSGTGLVRSRTGEPATEADDHLSSADHPRAATEEAADALFAAGVGVTVLRLPQVHDARRQGRISWHVELAREKGWVTYVGEGHARVHAVHVSDAVRLYRMALERGEAGARFHAVAEEGVALRDVAGAIGVRLGLPVVSLAPNEAAGYFGWMASLAAADLPASGAWTRERLGWQPSGPGLLADLAKLEILPA